MAEAPYLIALALLEQDGQRAMPLQGQSLREARPSDGDPGEEGRGQALELLVRVWQRSEQAPLRRAAGRVSLLLAEVPMPPCWTSCQPSRPSGSPVATPKPCWTGCGSWVAVSGVWRWRVGSPCGTSDWPELASGGIDPPGDGRRCGFPMRIHGPVPGWVVGQSLCPAPACVVGAT
ncbi:MAG: hypothetical protein ACKO7Z_07860 [Cyanobacteriota bacterium]